MELIKSIPFYHGTDARMIEMTETERQQYLDDCNRIIDYLSPFYLPLLEEVPCEIERQGQIIKIFKTRLEVYYKDLLNEKGEQYLYENLYEKLNMLQWKNNNAGLYQYGDFYLTTNKRMALDYARRSYAGGEIALIAYRLIQGSDIINFADLNLDKDQIRIIERIKEFAKEGKECPVIVTFNNIDLSCLQNEDGTPLPIDDITIFSNYRYSKAQDLKWDIIENVNRELIDSILNGDDDDD